VLRALSHDADARLAFREALTLEPSNPEARAGLVSHAGELPHELRIGTDFDFFNYTDTSKAVTVSLRSQWSPRWTGSIAGTFQNRFEEQTGRFLASVSYRFDRHNAITVGGGAGRHRGVIPKGEAFFEYDRGFNFGSGHFIRGVELVYGQRWLWFQDARILVLSPGAIFYLPKDFTWSLHIPVARSRFPGLPAEWRPSGITKLTFPVHRVLTGNVFYAVGTENFAQVDQVGRFSARTWGGGVRHQINSRQDITAYVLYQDRSQGRTQTSFGITYGIRF
jgi:YaiO family outer membrane protein